MRILALSSLLLLAVACGSPQAQTPLPKPVPPPLEFLGQWGTRGNGPGQFAHPVGIATDFAGNVYVADAETAFIHKFNPQGHPLLSFQDPGLKGVASLAVDQGGAIYAGITQAPFGIIIFYPDGTRLRRMGRLHAPPESIAVDDEGNLFALCPSAGIEKFNSRGRLVKFWRKRGEAPGEFAHPTAIAVGSDGLLYIAEMGNARIQRLSRNGELVSTWQITEAGQQNVPAIVSIAALKKNLFLLLLDQGQFQLQVRSVDGQWIVQDALGGHVPANLKEACEISVSPRGELFLLDKAGARILRFRINL